MRVRDLYFHFRYSLLLPLTYLDHILFLKFLRQRHPGIILHTIKQTLNQVPKELFVGATWCIAFHFGAWFICHFCLKSEFVSCLWQAWHTLVSTWTLRHLTVSIIDSTVTRPFNEEWPLFSKFHHLKHHGLKMYLDLHLSNDEWTPVIVYKPQLWLLWEELCCALLYTFGFGGGGMFMIPCTESIGWCFSMPNCSHPITKSSVHLV